MADTNQPPPDPISQTPTEAPPHAFAGPEAVPRPRLRHRLREKLPELFLEALSVVFAVLLALGVDEWRENRARLDLAARAQESIVKELRANRAELERIRKENAPHMASLASQIATMEKRTVRSVSVNMQLAQLSSAAWTAAQSTQASQLIKFEWLVTVSNTYEAQKLYVQMQTDILSGIGDIAAVDTQKQRLTLMRGVQSRLSLLSGILGQLARAYDEALAEAPKAN